ncbi:MAG: hypothetical protein HOV94_32465, partial [Saccharothrix sp.]|nr:hypothetical protein [Saccharothrix sp.]
MTSVPPSRRRPVPSTPTTRPRVAGLRKRSDRPAEAADTPVDETRVEDPTTSATEPTATGHAAAEPTAAKQTAAESGAAKQTAAESGAAKQTAAEPTAAK